MRALFTDHSPKRREQAPRTSNNNMLGRKTSQHSSNSSNSSVGGGGGGGGGAAAARRMRAKANTVMQPAQSNRRRNIALLKFGEEDRKSQTSLDRTREHARQLAQKMSDDAMSPEKNGNGRSPPAFADFASFQNPHVNESIGDGDTDSAFHSQASSFFDEDPFGNEPVLPAVRKQTKADPFVAAADWPPHFASPKSMSTMPSNSSMQSSYATQYQHQGSMPQSESTRTPHRPTSRQQRSSTQPRLPETPEIRPSPSGSSSTGAAARRRMRQQMKHGTELTPPASPLSLNRLPSGDSSLGSSQQQLRNQPGDYMQGHSNRHRTGLSSNRSSARSVASSTSGSGIFDTRTGVGGGFTFDAFGLDASQIDAQVNEAMKDLAGTHPDLSFFDNDDDFANGKWNQQASPAPSRASTPPIAEETEGFVDGFRVTKQSVLPVQIRQQHSPSSTERSSLTSESNIEEGRVNLFKEKASFASSRPRMVVRPPNSPPDRNLYGSDMGVDRRGRVPMPAMPDLAGRAPLVEFVGEDSEASFPVSAPQRLPQHPSRPPTSDAGAPSDGGVASDVGVQSGADSDVAIQSDHGRNVSSRSYMGRDLPLEVLSKKKSSTDTATTTETNSTYNYMSYEEKKEEDKPEPQPTRPVRNAMSQWQQRDKAAEQTSAVETNRSPSKAAASYSERDPRSASVLTMQSLESYQSNLDQQQMNGWPSSTKQQSPSKPTFRAPKSEEGAAALSPSIIRRLATAEPPMNDAKSETGPSPFQINLRKTGLLNGRPAEDDAERPVTPLGTKRPSPRNGDADYALQHLQPPQVQTEHPSPRAAASANSLQTTISQNSQPITHVDQQKKLTYRERRELELQKQQEEERQREQAKKSPEKDVASLVRKRIAENRKAANSSYASTDQYEAQDRETALRSTSAAEPTSYARSSLNDSSRELSNYSKSLSSYGYAPEPARNGYRQEQGLTQSESEMSREDSRDLSIENTDQYPNGPKEEVKPSAAVSHLLMLQQLQSKKEQSVDVNSMEARHQMLISVGSGDAEDHKKSSTPKATKMMLNAFLAGRCSIGEGETSTAPSDGQAGSSGGHGGLPALKDDPKYEKYFKMLKLGMPKDVVKHAMFRDGEDPKLLDQDPNLPAGIPLKDDPTYQKYFKMLKIGMPMDAVKHAMIRDGLDCSVMDQDPNLPASTMHKKEDDDEPKERDSRRRARLHWKTLRKVTSNSLWAKIDQEVNMEHIEIDEEEFQELFQAEHDEVKPAKTTAGAPAKGVTVRVIDPKRANNGGIILARLKMSHDDMADAVDRINEHALNAEQIENIIEYLPSKEERKALEAYMLEGGQDAAEKFEGLCECEKFMVSMMTVKHAKRKVRALLFKLQFEKCLDDILKDTLAIEAACDNLTHSVRLRQLLGIILNFGNRLNTAGNKRRRAGAFTLDSLLKLNQAKAFDRKTTFLNYIILIVHRNNEILLNFKDDLPAVFKADKVFWDQCLSDLDEVESQLENVRKIALYQARQAHYRFRRRKRDEGDDESLSDGDLNLSLEEEVEFLRSTPIGMFTLSAIKYVSSLRDKVEETKSKFAYLLEYFGEEDKNLQPHELFATIVTFCRDFEKAKEEVFAQEKKKQREERKRQVGRPPTHSPAPATERKPMLRASAHQPNFSDVMHTSSRPQRQSIASNQNDPRSLGAVDGQDDYNRATAQPSQIRQQSQHGREQSYTVTSEPESRQHRYSEANAQSVYQQSDQSRGHQAQSQQQANTQNRHTYDRSYSAPYETDPRTNSYTRSSSMPRSSNDYRGGQQPTERGAQYSSEVSYTPSPPSGGAVSAAARLKAKARIQLRSSPTPIEDQERDVNHGAQARAAHYEAQARATAQAAGQELHIGRQNSSPVLAESNSESSNISSLPSRSPRSSFHHKRRMEARRRAQATMRG